MTKEEKLRLLELKNKGIEKHAGSPVDYHETVAAGSNKNLHISCYKCRAGCIHLEYESLMITCTEDEFYQLSDVIIQLRNSLFQDEMQRRDEDYVLAGILTN